MQPVARPEGDAQARYGVNLVPIDHVPSSLTTPMFVYSYERTREALERMRRGRCIRVTALKMQYVNPVTGGSAMPTIAAFIQLLPNGFEGTIALDRRHHLLRRRRPRA